MVTWGVSDVLEGFKCGKGILAQQLSYWQDNISLYRHTLQVTTDSDRINTNLGVALAEKGEMNAAIHEFQEALRINPNNRQARNNLCITLAQMKA